MPEMNPDINAQEDKTASQSIISDTKNNPITMQEENTTENIENVSATATSEESSNHAEVQTETEEVQSTPVIHYEDKEAILNRLQEIASAESYPERNELDSLKQQFYRFIHAEINEAKQLFIEQNGPEAEFIPTPSEAEATYKTIMATIKEKRTALAEQIEKEKEENLKKKEAIIEHIKAMVEGTGDVNKNYNEFKQLQNEWNEIKNIPASKVNDLWKSYQFYVEQFYDLLKINKEFRDYDFKKNLEAKTQLCVTAEKLKEESDVVSAFHQLQKLHQSFRDIGPVAKELREELWNRFKAASTEINRRHQQHFENLKASEQKNQELKTAICEKIEAIQFDTLKTFAEWNQKTKEIIDLQAEWKTIGFAPQKMNQKIFERFRAACDEFFHKKADFFKGLKEDMSANLEKKKALCEKAEALKDSTNWRETSEILTKLQKEWKEIGSVQKKHSDAIWKRFITACDYFFEQKNKATSSQRNAEQENLAKKKEIIQQLEELDLTVEGEEAIARIKKLVREFNEIGHVPFRDKDKIYNKFKALADQEFNRLHISAVNRKLSNYKNSLNKGTDKEPDFMRERRDLMRQYDILKNEIQTYENNLGFLNANSKKGNSLVNDLNRKVEKLKEDLALVVEKIKLLDEANSNARKEQTDKASEEA